MHDVIDELRARDCPQDDIDRFVGNKWNEMKVWLRNHEIKRVRNSDGSAGDIENAAKAFKPQSAAKFEPLE